MTKLGNDAAIDLLQSPVHLSAGSKAILVDAFEGDYEGYIRRFCKEGDPGFLVAIFHSSEDWPSWESHPAGEEVVILISGKAEFIQLIGGVERRVVLTPGHAVINPAGVRHTANVIEPFSAVYITPGPGTEHHPRDLNASRF